VIVNGVVRRGEGRSEFQHSPRGCWGGDHRLGASKIQGGENCQNGGEPAMSKERRGLRMSQSPGRAESPEKLL